VNSREQSDGPENQQPNVKKTYRKPAVQVYGTLSQVTGTRFTPGKHADGGTPAPFAPAPSQNRT
jgi:hypothetical protein